MPSTNVLLVVSSVFLYIVYRLKHNKHSFRDVPAVGYTFPGLSYWSALKYFANANAMIEEGYQKYRGRTFKLPETSRWLIVVTGPKLIEELRRAPEEQLSFEAAIKDSLLVRYTLGPLFEKESYHIPIIRGRLTRSIGNIFDDIRDELFAAYTDNIPATDDWVSVPALESVMNIVGRISNRVFVGLPACREPKYVEGCIQFTNNVVKSVIIILLFPHFLRPLIGSMLTSVPGSIDLAETYLGPIIRERYRMMEKYGEKWEGKPNDFLMWLMEEAEGEEREVRALVSRILGMNFAAIHTSSMSFTHALYALASNEEYTRVMREEVESIVNEEGWTKNSMQKMRKVDSFMKESQRMYGLGALGMTRKAVRDFTFSDGTFIPAGEFVCAASRGTHLDDANYEDPEIFKPWRFADMRSEDGESTKHQMVNTSASYISFGHGRHACPGRFFAVNEIKAMMAYTVLNYDVKLVDGKIPPPSWFKHTLRPNPTACVMYRKRRL